MDTLEYQPGTNPPVPIISVTHQLAPGRYLVHWFRSGDPVEPGPARLRECMVVELSPTAKRARVVWETVPVDQEWVDAEVFYQALAEHLGPMTSPVPGPTMGRIPGTPQAFPPGQY